MKIKAYVKRYDRTAPVTEIDFKNKEVEVDLSDGNGDTSNFNFNEVKLSVDGSTSDGYHTFDELYHHRMILFSIICNQNKENAWKSMKHHDGTMYDNYFIVGITTDEGDYTYHYDIRNWNYFDVKELPTAPVWDGHKPEDIARLLTLIEKEPKRISIQQRNEFLEKAHKTNINIADNMKEERNQYKRLAESYARIINGMISDAEEIKRLMLRANESYTNNKDYEVNWNILKVLDMLQEIEV